MKINSWEELCTKKGYDPMAILPDVSMFPEKHQKALNSVAKLFLIADEVNEGHEFDWNDDDEKKWYPWFDMEVDKNNPSGFRFSDASFGYTYSFTTGGSRLCFRTEEDAEFMGKTFLELYRDVMVVPK